MTPQEAVEAPRVWTQGQDVEIEIGVPEKIRVQVAAKGHRVTPVVTVGGGMNIVRFEAGGSIAGAACWRADGHAVGIGGGLARAGIRFRPAAGELEQSTEQAVTNSVDAPVTQQSRPNVEDTEEQTQP